ncbi:Uncharacterised protein [uncultured archaeon]|nr:Uncharacterised protein [uncultured archaeon]
MASMTEYYGRMKGGLSSIDPKDMAQLSEDWLVVAGTGAAIGLISGAIGGLDKKVAGFNVPIDGLLSIGLGVAGLQMKGDTGKILKIASVAAGGSAAVRTFERFFKGAFHVKGELEDLGSGMMGISGHRFHGQNQLPGYGYGVGFGVGAQDRLVEAAKYL